VLGTVLLTGISADCGTPTESQLVGKYRVESTCMTASLVLNKDHSFSQNVHLKTGETRQVQGTWRLEPSPKVSKAAHTVMGRLIARYSPRVAISPYLDVGVDDRVSETSAPFSLQKSSAIMLPSGQ
jgi:hypothetical protein